MDQTVEGFPILERKFIEWAREEDGIRAAFVVGSRARLDHPADASSDLDIAILAANPRLYLEDAGWVERIGKSWLTFTEPTGSGPFWERRVLFEGGYDVDFAFLPVGFLREVLAKEFPPDLAGIVQRGVRLLFDKDGMAAQFLEAAPYPPPARPPSQAEFLNLVNDFWYHAVWTAKKIQRGELWTAKMCSDSYMKWRLLSLIEWHARLVHGPRYDTWHSGRYLEEWADPDILADLQGTFSTYAETSIWRGLFASMDLFHRLAIETAERLGCPYPLEGELHATRLVQAIHNQMKIPDQT